MNTDINTRAMLVTLSTSVYNPVKLDRRTTAEVTQLKRAARDAGAYKKNLVPKELIEPVVKAATAVYNDHKRLTSPWADGGTRILCVDMFEKYCDAISGGQRIFAAKVEEFIRRYEDIRAEAPVRMGDTYDPKDYPPVGAVRARFGVRTDWQPLPNSSDFRVHLQEDELSEVRASVDDKVREAVEAARTDLHNRLKDRLRHVIDRLSKPDTIFRDSLIEGLRELCKMIPKMCLTPDPDLEAAVDRTLLQIACYDPDDLRDDDGKRADACRAAKAILDSMPATDEEVKGAA